MPSPSERPPREQPGKLPAILWLAVVLLATAILGWQFQSVFSGAGASPIETNILKLLPQNRQDPVAQQAFDQVAGEMEDKLLFLVKAPTAASALAAASAFESQLRGLPWLTEVQGKISQDEQQAWGKLYYGHRFNLLTDEQQARLKQTPEAQTNKVVQALYNPFSGVTGQELANDPFLLFRDFLTSLGQQAGNFQLDNGFLLAHQQDMNGQDSAYILLTAKLTDSPYSQSLQEQLPQLSNIEARLEQQTYDGHKVKVLHTGVLFYAAFGTQSAKAEISTIGAGSLLGVILLLLLVYRSALPMTLALLSIGSGLLCALVGTILIFGKVHLFSLVFGASLIGVSIDYAFHFLTDRLAAGRHWNSMAGLKHIFAAITLGLVTSLVGYLSMLVAPFPGLQQLAVFSAIGLISAWLTVVCWYPLLAYRPVEDKPLPLVGTLDRLLKVWRTPGLRYLLPVTILLASVASLYHLQYDDDIRQLQALPQELKTQEAEIQAVTGMGSTQQMLLVKGQSPQAVLAKLSKLDKQLDSLIKQDSLASYRSLGSYLPAVIEQQQNHDLITALYHSQGSRLASTLGMKQPLQPPGEFSPLTLDDFLASPAADNLSFLWLGKIQGQYASVVVLSGIRDASALTAMTATDSDISLLDKANEISQLFGEYRQRITELLVLAFGLIFALLTVRYRWRQALWIMLPTLVATTAGLAVTNLTGLPLNLFNLLALILILGIGIDYSLFFAEQGRRQEDDDRARQSTLLAISLSAATTLLSFGLLALSDTMAIHSFGITVLTGIIVAWLLAPVSMNANMPQRETQNET